MNKKHYISPQTVSIRVASVQPLAGSQLNPDGGNSQSITVTDQVYDGEFTSRRGNVWGNEEEEGL